VHTSDQETRQMQYILCKLCPISEHTRDLPFLLARFSSCICSFA